MVQTNHDLSTIPSFSIVIAVYNDWVLLNECLQSLAGQANAPDFEAIVVDDGSGEPAPEFIQQWARRYPLTIVREPHTGIPAARNRGIQVSRGSLLVFVDADCRFSKDCLAALGSTVANSRHDYFQLHLVGDCTNLLGRAEELRLSVFQNHTLQPDGCIRYLNTAGFAIRRARVDIRKGLFNPKLPRGEDTLLLAQLIQKGELPFFVANATVQHVVPFSLVWCLRKDMRSAYLERASYDLVASMGLRIRVKNRDRFSMLLDMWKTSRSRRIGRSAWFVVLTRQLVRRIFSLVYSTLRIRPGSRVQVNPSALDGK